MIQLYITPKKVLVVARTLEGISHVIGPLREAGCWVEVATSADEAIGRAAVLNPEIVVIEDPLADVSSMELSVQIRNIVSAPAAPTFIMAPTSELTSEPARVPEASELSPSATGHAPAATLIRRIAGLMPPATPPTSAKSPERVTGHGLALDRVRFSATIGDRKLKLTPTEFRLLWALASRPGCVLSRVELAKACKGSTDAVQSRTIDAHIKSIRRKLNDHAQLVETVHGVGYRFQELDP
jgi:two-component system phosphate regulon response regulator PhoB